MNLISFFYSRARGWLQPPEDPAPQAEAEDQSNLSGLVRLFQEADDQDRADAA